MLTENSRLREVYAHPVGRDIIRKILLQAGRGDRILRNPLIGGLKLKSIPKLTMGRVGNDFIATLLEVLNTERDAPREDNSPAKRAWWKEAVFYQIYPRSFHDGNGDGIGDLRGILQRLDYLQALGVDALWLSPIYDSPNDDNGYDIRDYRKIMAEFGTMADFDALLAAVHARGMRLIMDLVVNHTSDEHEWFQKALHEPDSPYGDYYFFRDRPNNWTSFFSGSAWNYYEERKQYGLHLFSKKQMDLNWDNPAVRGEVKDMVRWWLEKGVDGFRMDVINYISKREGLPEGNESIGALMGYCGVEHYFYGPHLHEYLRELHREAFAPFHAFSVGETPGLGMEMSKLLTADSREELNMVFNFDQLETPGHVRFDDYRYDLNYYKAYMIDWMKHYGSHSQMSLFYENHDNPRMISKVDPDPQYRDVLAKLLAVMQLTLRGTPFLFQGQELGMVNQDFSSIRDLRDVESLNLYGELCKTMSEAEAFRKVLAGTRDHARTPMQWTNGAYGGFSAVQPWSYAGDDCKSCNAAAQEAAKDSVWNFYRGLIALRKAHESLTYGEIRITNEKEPGLFTYTRSAGDETFYVECALGRAGKPRKNGLPDGERLLSNYPSVSETALRPYEAAVWLLR